jgi:predicted esterase YcpF (UPF0227 family)
MGTLFYIPEFLSTTRTERAELFAALCEKRGWKFIPMDYPSCDPVAIYENFTVKMYASQHYLNNIIIGTGLGGFWANYFAKDIMAKTVLINPCVNPTTTLYKFMDTDSDIVYDSEGKECLLTEQMIDKYTLYESMSRSHYGSVLFIAKDDPVMDWRLTTVLFKNVDDMVIRLYRRGGHTLDEHMGQVIIDAEQLMEIPYYMMPRQAEVLRRQRY